MPKKAEEKPIEIQKNLDEDEIDLYELFQILWKRKKLVLNITLVLLILGILITLFIPSTYNVSVSLSFIQTTQVQNPPILITDEFISLFDLTKGELNQELKKEILDLKGVEFKKTKPTSPNRIILELKFTKLPDKETLQKYINMVIRNINKNSEISRILKEETQIIKSRYEFINENLESYKKIPTKIKQNLLEKNMNVGFNPAELDESILKMRTELLMLKKFLDNADSLFKKSETFSYTVSQKPNRSMLIAVVLVSSIFLGIFSAFVVEYLQNLKNRKQ